MTIPAWMKVGVKCVCVDGDFAAEGPMFRSNALPLKGVTYTIRETRPSTAGLRLVEIVNPARCYINGTRECWFSASRFRPLVDDSDEAIQRDVALFTEHLSPPRSATKRKARADA